MRAPLTDADIQRLKRHPIKTCPGCKRDLPNTLEHFAMGRGKITKHCHDCIAAIPVPTKCKKTCPCCLELKRVYRDGQAPTPTWLCRPCLMLVNAIDAVTPQVLEKAMGFVRVRREKAEGR